ncbi:sensor domain-containing diguanylate cyclase [Sphingomonas xinjiangensis]|uniref:Diguanylate cyclase (GGDEF)-like protein/PAS domain S-box-containing protein n=1 Tax=Sphingomonas xinjiangensis TaxID=643568 RepID=A0A840YGS5_9SPHN|nr:diguanylate cyclase [Sphingomonas xinjiangensis]MBB5712064.1 diguanylate cyclase (GGDEF)-like protein/PAS domain S-box-containing protein [Sphingomonas xinjiangensis]
MAAALTPNFRGSIRVGVSYFFLAVLTITVTRFEGGVAFVWLANAALLARLLTLRQTHWLPSICACGLAGCLATASFGLGPEAAFPMTVANLLESAVAATLIQRFTGKQGSFKGQRALLTFFLSAGLAAPAISGLIGASVVSMLAAGGYWANWSAWFTGHALGAIIFTPVAFHFARRDAARWISAASRRRIVEAALLVLLVGAVSAVVFAQRTVPLLFLPTLPITVATFRGGRLPAALSVIVLAIVAGAFTLSGRGPMSLIDGSIGTQIQFLQFYLASTVVTILPVSTELTRRKEIVRALRASEARYRVLTDNSTDVILNLDLSGRVQFASRAVQQMTGLSSDQVVGTNIACLVRVEDAAAVRRATEAAMTDPGLTFTFECRVPSQSRENRWFEAHARGVRDADSVIGAVCAIRDITERKALEDRLSDAAFTDPLTGMANRRAFDAALKARIEASTDFGGCVAIFDLDYFKRVNDRFGHAAGDAVLRQFANIIRGSIRNEDFAARIGGEEFALVLPGASIIQARLICERLRNEAAATPMLLDAQSIRVTVSGGVAGYSARSAPNVVLAEADAALYESKAKGRNRLTSSSKATANYLSTCVEDGAARAGGPSFPPYGPRPDSRLALEGGGPELLSIAVRQVS